ncbi:oleate hydratase [Aquimarina pacifica]|uniref:oleate hydratase n=1 Tax=Aquimarina pacifica TaxID=1296415 RepID=UPI0004728DE9|nr:oleate hydratase [Aquimarina pacifica]
MKKKICIWGSGWSGLTAALEISESQECEVHVHESSSQFGGKVSGTVKEKNKISTHAIRLISEYYPAFADVCSRIPTTNNKTLIDRWSPVEYFNFYSTSKNKVHKVNRKINKGLISNLQLLFATIFTFELHFKDIIAIAKAINQFRSLNEEKITQLEKEKLTIEQYLKTYNLSDTAKDFLFTYLGITVAARPTSTASMSLDLMSKMFVGVQRSEHLMKEHNKNFKSWVIDGPLGERLIPPFIEELKRRGVHLHLNSAITEFKKNNNEITAITQSNKEIAADTHIVALNNKVIEKLKLGRKEQPLNNEWSIGAIFPLKSIPKSLKKIHKKTVTAVMDSSWAIVFVVWSKHKEGGLWSDDVIFPEEYNYFLEIVTSRLDHKGTNNKTFFECNPKTAAREILTQIGIEEKLIPELEVNATYSDNLSYTNNPIKDEFSLYSKTNPDGYYWKLYAPIYTSSPNTLPLEVTTALPGIFLCGEAIATKYPYIKTPTLELTSEAAKEAAQHTFDYLNISQKVNQHYPDRFAKRQKP